MNKKKHKKKKKKEKKMKMQSFSSKSFCQQLFFDAKSNRLDIVS